MAITLRRSLQRLGTQSSAKPLTMSADAIARLNEYRQRVERPKPAKGVDATAAAHQRRTCSSRATGDRAVRRRKPRKRFEAAIQRPRKPPGAPCHRSSKRQRHTPPAPIPPDPALRQMQRLTRRGFATGAIAALTGAAGWGWLRSRAAADGIPWPLRRMLEWNQLVAQAYFRPTRLAPTFATTSARMPRVNGHVGLDGHFDPETWSLHVNNSTGAIPLELSLDGH